MHTPSSPKTGSLSHQAAKLSWACPIILFLLLTAGRHMGSPVVIDLVGLLLILIGLIGGIVALFGISKHGRKGILAPAMVGIIINCLLFLIFVTNFMAARAKVIQQHGSRGTSPVSAARGQPAQPSIN